MGVETKCLICHSPAPPKETYSLNKWTGMKSIVHVYTHTHTHSHTLSLSLSGSDGVKCAGYSPNSFKSSGSVPTCCSSKANFPGCTTHFFLGVCTSSNGRTGGHWGQFPLFPWQLLTGLTVPPPPGPGMRTASLLLAAGTPPYLVLLSSLSQLRNSLHLSLFFCIIRWSVSIWNLIWYIRQLTSSV